MSINVKQLAAEKAVEFVKDGMKIGLGTGSTAYWAINKLGERVSEGLKITAVATSRASEEQARELGIPIVAFGDIDSLDLTIDGADELDSSLQLIKGGGGALLREKIVASNSTRMIVIADESKVVNTLGKFPLPVEIVPFAWEWTVAKLAKLGCNPELRRSGEELYKTDNGNYIADCRFEVIESAPKLALTIQSIPGVVEHGLFIGIAAMAIVGKKDGSIEIIEAKPGN
ncbi:ribose 5-phosphate isomerase A [Paenibacillus sp. PastH-3]|jgi:ribose 5-phosphate isomerase A|nr:MULTISPECIES: ribose-5-phosphate isomerase RpiA [Paenibacillus]MDH6426885.1 ribose 5-phosphate isomerase A [Paenibacillus sp. PastH-4]MDH6442913.1 ribose 5-phosphate isomerase A [Paenibacillus sp. PastF-4]MDH6526379.1 ribose 5-phosphate isomerase A [Paenibacillus sp. PastH-3]OMD60919.1 ribose 5-phosphate isomerase A [Paenibacillus odorifer]